MWLVEWNKKLARVLLLSFTNILVKLDFFSVLLSPLLPAVLNGGEWVLVFAVTLISSPYP